MAINRLHAILFHRLGTEIEKLSDSQTFGIWKTRNPHLKIKPRQLAHGRIVFIVHNTHTQNAIAYESASALIAHAHQEMEKML